MASGSGNNVLPYGYTALEVLDLLESQELSYEEEQRFNFLATADCDSEGTCDESIGGYIDDEGVDQQIEPGYLRPLSTTLLFEAQGCPMPAERDSVLLLDPDLDDNLDSSEPAKRSFNHSNDDQNGTFRSETDIPHVGGSVTTPANSCSASPEIIDSTSRRRRSGTRYSVTTRSRSASPEMIDSTSARVTGRVASRRRGRGTPRVGDSVATSGCVATRSHSASPEIIDSTSRNSRGRVTLQRRGRGTPQVGDSIATRSRSASPEMIDSTSARGTDRGASLRRGRGTPRVGDSVSTRSHSASPEMIDSTSQRRGRGTRNSVATRSRSTSPEIIDSTSAIETDRGASRRRGRGTPRMGDSVSTRSRSASLVMIDSTSRRRGRGTRDSVATRSHSTSPEMIDSTSRNGRSRGTSRRRGRGTRGSVATRSHSTLPEIIDSTSRNGRGRGTSRRRGRGTRVGDSVATRSRSASPEMINSTSRRGRGGSRRTSTRGRGATRSRRSDVSADWNWKGMKSSEHAPKYIPFNGSLPGPTEEAMDASAVMDCLGLFLPMVFFEELLLQTNKYAEQCRSARNITYPWSPIKKEELLGFIAIVVSMGLIGLPGYKDYWSSDPILCHSWFRTVLSRDRFIEIKRYLHLVDNSVASSSIDKLWKVRPMISLLQERSQKMYDPHQQISIDESMIGTKARLSFLQYMPKKPTKWGIKVWICADSVTGYIYNFDVYTGADPSIPKYPKGLAHHVVMKLVQPLLGKGYVVYMDNFYSSPVLFEDLLAENTTATGTIRSNRKNFPKFSRVSPEPTRGTCHFQYCKNMIAICWRDKRDILALSTDVGDEMTKVSRRSGSDILEVECPVLIEEYNTFMGGVDMADQYMCYYSLGRKTKKWWLHVFWRLFDHAILNALIVYRSNQQYSLHKILNQKEFRLQLAHSLCAGALSSRITGRPPSLSLTRMLGKHFVYKSETRARCVVCGQKKLSSRSKKKKDKKVKTQCSKCHVNLCVGRCFDLYHTRVDYLRQVQ